MKIPFSPPYIDKAVIKEVNEVLESGWITTGPKVKQLETEIRNLSGAEEVLCVNSWTSGAIMILRWLGLKKGDEVIIPAYTYCATALAVLHAGGIPVMVDTSDDFNISLQAIKNAITDRTKAIIPVDIAGWPCDYESIMELVESSQIKALFKPSSPVQEKLQRILVLSDSAHSMGAKYLGHTTGSEVDISIFSLHAVKNITTAEGGAICLSLPKQSFDNEQVYNELRQRSLNCQTKDAFTKSKVGGWRYDIVGLGMKINMADINAAIGLAQIRQLEQLKLERKRVFSIYKTILSKYSWAIIPPSNNEKKETSFHLFSLRIKDISEAQRDDIIAEISKKDVAVNVHFIPMPMLSFFKGLGYRIEDYPQAYKNYSTEISLPIYPQLSNEDAVFVAETVVNAYNKVVSND